MALPKRRRRPGGAKAGSRRTKQRRRVRQISMAARNSVGGGNRQPLTGGVAMRDALASLSAMGIAVDSDRGVIADVGAARRQAEQAAGSVAAAVGINIHNDDGSLNAAAARRAVSVILDFDIEQTGSSEQAVLMAQAKQAVAELSANLGADIFDSNGQPDATKARQLVNVALDLRDPAWLPLTRRDALVDLKQKLRSVPGANLPSRRQASQALDRQLSLITDNKSLLASGGPPLSTTKP